MTTPKKKLLIVADDHPRIREALKHILAELHGSTTLYTGDDPSELRRLANKRLDEADELTVADVSLAADGQVRGGGDSPVSDGRELPLMVVSMQEGGITANWFVAIESRPGQEGDDDRRIKAALDQHNVVMELIRGLRDAAHESGVAELEPLQDIVSPESLMKLGITLRQAEVLVLLADGLTNKEIARKLDVSEWTVRHHVSSILERLDVSNRGRAAIFARKLAQVGVRGQTPDGA